MAHAAMLPEGQTGLERVVTLNKACDRCKEKKIRCDPSLGSCTQCIKSNIPCTFSPIKVKKGPRRPPGYKHVEKLEERLKRMEAMLRAESTSQPATTEVEEQQSDADLRTDYIGTHPRSKSPKSNRIQKRKRRTSIEIVSSAEQHISVSPHEPHLALAAGLHHKPLNWSLTGTTINREVKSLPGRDEAQLLIQETFSSFNSAFPIFDATNFQKSFESSYEDKDPDNPAWRACLNVVFAFAHRFRAMKTGNIIEEDVHACGYLQNALVLVGELSMLTNELMAVQALLGMAILLQGTPNPEPGPILISMAVRIAQGMKLHRRGQQHGIAAAAEMEQRKCVFWLLYIYDKDISIRTHNPPAQDDDDIDIDLPIETIDLHNDRLNEVNFYNNHIGLSIIQGQIYKQLLSTRAQKSSEIDRLRNAKQLVTVLEAWKQSIPCILLVENFNTTHEAPSFFILLHSIILKFTYFHTLETVRSQAHIANLDTLCLVEARESMQLLQLLPQGDFAYVWLLLDVIISACTLMLTYAITQQKLEDLELVEHVFTLLDLLKDTSRTQDVAKMAEFLRGLKEEAGVATGKHMHINKVPEVGSERIRSKEEFFKRMQELSSEKCAEYRAAGSRDE
ncbi:fungal-specific transcription factor domain-containing protein [Rhexocercosporidium sp. MPI-PUGE-AT-0058]|nr:fungal-specific transcription factor domain-containing protein [Rhexocercosporidium sp. MPI-PUGE-AT-0058]